VLAIFFYFILALPTALSPIFHSYLRFFFFFTDETLFRMPEHHCERGAFVLGRSSHPRMAAARSTTLDFLFDFLQSRHSSTNLSPRDYQDKKLPYWVREGGVPFSSENIFLYEIWTLFQTLGFMQKTCQKK
jgi:hypothetical protein